MTIQHRRWVAGIVLAAMLGGPAGFSPSYAGGGNDQEDNNNDQGDNGQGSGLASPIEHVIVIIGENRSFDNIYATYVPKQGQFVWNLRSQGIVNANGSPGPNQDAARQFQIATVNPVAYFISTNALTNPNKTAYAPFLPTPEVGFAPPLPVTLAQFEKDPADTVAPFDAKSFSTSQLQTISPVLLPADLVLLTTGATGLTNCAADPTLPRPTGGSSSGLLWRSAGPMVDPNAPHTALEQAGHQIGLRHMPLTMRATLSATAGNHNRPQFAVRRRARPAIAGGVVRVE